MKKTKKLKLAKETVRRLTGLSLGGVFGAGSNDCTSTTDGCPYTADHTCVGETFTCYNTVGVVIEPQTRNCTAP